MNERTVVISKTDGEVGITLGALYRYFTVLQDMTIIGIVVSPSVDDAGLTIDLNDDGTVAIAAIAAAVKAVPGTWLSTHLGGTNAPVQVAAGSVMSLDANAAAANTVVSVDIYALLGTGVI